MSHSGNVKKALAAFEAAVSSGDRDGAYEALAEAQTEAAAVHKAKSAPHARAASATSTSADADVVAACDSATAACAVPPVTTTGSPPVVGGVFDDLWSLFIANAPAILSWIRKLFSPAAPTP